MLIAVGTDFRFELPTGGQCAPIRWFRDTPAEHHTALIMTCVQEWRKKTSMFESMAVRGKCRRTQANVRVWQVSTFPIPCLDRADEIKFS
jgi:hypothetical protein